ncbi:DUF2993 domain-containing protein [Fimbriimonas ginsengisoli]|uniref:DUF2993 domain-containing protein n=1 Tax=Fimbriimonas ginsengisoli Gsoil 348 TaxID=661478 RepID=A0A068NVP4_FIMGI|nr:DUF2993 domain-containing protein [Fimbriimonas ginsengisoli]AIE87558.1 hypothetical protein OP10G_4190 [Fimbriimonas ginsengisoli Gsoil 348]
MPHEEKVDVGEFTVHLRDVLLPMGLRVDDVRFGGKGLHIERSPLVISAPEPGQLEAFVGEASLAEFLNAKAPAGLRKFQVRAKDGKLFVDAVKTVLVDLKASAVCTLRIEDGRKLMVDIESVDVAGAGIKTLLQNQLDKVNPIFDIAEFPVDASLDSVRVEDGGVLLFGHVRPPAS